MTFGPQKSTIQAIAINSIGTLIAGIIGSMIIITMMFLLSRFLGFSLNSGDLETGIRINNIFPFFFSLVTFVATTITVLINYYILTLTNIEKYKKNIISSFHVLFFSIIIYILITPIYIYIGIKSYSDIFYVFLLHNLIIFLGTSLILELLNNYKYVLLGFYSSFIGFFITILLLVLIFGTTSSSQGKILSFVILLPLVNFLSYLFKQIFEFLYYQYYKYTGMDQLGDIFYQIERDEKE
nr:hypothetical protein [Candidatus Gracilibacteria bacterium]